MDKRTIFTWNIILGFSVLLILFYSYKIYNLNTDKNELWEIYLEDEIGTDDKLYKKVIELEEKYERRKNFKFKMKRNPVDLSNVINFEGLEYSGTGFKAIKLLHITQTENGQPLATVKFKNNYFNLFKGDTLAGGKVISVTKTEMQYARDDEVYSYSVKPNKIYNNN